MLKLSTIALQNTDETLTEATTNTLVLKGNCFCKVVYTGPVFILRDIFEFTCIARKYLG